MGNQANIQIYREDPLWEQAVVRLITDIILQSLTNQDYCTISLSGGSTPRRIYEILAREELKPGIPWERIKLFWGDERAVPHDHVDSNFKMVKEALLDHIKIPAENVFPYPEPEFPDKSAALYEAELQNQFTPDGPTFDLTLLGMGDDGHTASIFPGTELVRETTAWVKEVYLSSKDTWRISVTAPVINRSRHIAFLVKGEGKAPALKEVLTGEYDPNHYPAQLIRRSPDVHYILDAEAARDISE